MPREWNSPAAIDAEREAFREASAAGIMRMRDRGPPAPQEGGPNSWKGQKWREGSQRWGNRGGKRKDEFAAFYAVKRRRDDMGDGGGGSSGSNLIGDPRT